MSRSWVVSMLSLLSTVAMLLTAFAVLEVSASRQVAWAILGAGFTLLAGACACTAAVLHVRSDRRE